MTSTVIEIYTAAPLPCPGCPSRAVHYLPPHTLPTTHTTPHSLGEVVAGHVHDAALLELRETVHHEGDVESLGDVKVVQLGLGELDLLGAQVLVE